MFNLTFDFVLTSKIMKNYNLILMQEILQKWYLHLQIIHNIIYIKIIYIIYICVCICI